MTAGSPAEAALVRVAWTPGRAEPSHRSELVTQWLFGERLDVEEEGRDGWLRVTGPDGYGSWVNGGGVRRTGPGEADLWEEEADRISLGTGLRPPLPRFLPWGARAVTAEGSRGNADEDLRVRLPDGRTAVPAEPDRLVAREECVLRYPPRPDALLATAADWIGSPYLWGGRTREGVDCSGYVQAVLTLHGVELPRDSGLQAGADEAVWTSEGEGQAETAPDAAGSEAGAGDLLALARDVLRPGDLLFFGTEAESITHVALWAEDTEILHAAAGRGQVARDDLAADDPLMERLRGRLLAVTRPLARHEEDRHRA